LDLLGGVEVDGAACGCDEASALAGGGVCGKVVVLDGEGEDRV
jgi:hypothetical protein